jgi:sulfopyruvate decarboxylase subunit beta
MSKNPALIANILQAFGKAGIDHLIHVPATGIEDIYRHYDELRTSLNVSREEEGVAVAAGMALGGKRPVLFIQQSGVGNMLNSFIGLADAYSIYFPIVVLNRGENDENPVQAHSASRTIALIKAIGEPVQFDFCAAGATEAFSDLVNKKTRWFITNY